MVLTQREARYLMNLKYRDILLISSLLTGVTGYVLNDIFLIFVAFIPWIGSFYYIKKQNEAFNNLPR